VQTVGERQRNIHSCVSQLLFLTGLKEEVGFDHIDRVSDTLIRDSRHRPSRQNTQRIRSGNVPSLVLSSNGAGKESEMKSRRVTDSYLPFDSFVDAEEGCEADNVPTEGNPNAPRERLSETDLLPPLSLFLSFLSFSLSLFYLFFSLSLSLFLFLFLSFFLSDVPIESFD
jgi:hypothetical protein